MSDLVEELIQEHKILLERITAIRTKGVRSPEGQVLLHETKELLLSHLRKEDHELYATLRQAAEDDPYLRRVLDCFAMDNGKAARIVGEFFEKYEAGGSKCLGYARDFARLQAILSSKIRREESVLYLEYEKVIDRQRRIAALEKEG